MKLATVLVFLAGCGGGGGGTVLDPERSWRLVPEQQLILGPFAVVAGAVVTYQVRDMPSGVGADRMDFVIATDAEARAGGTIDGYAIQRGVASVEATTPPLPAGSYDLVGWCRNLVDDCFFTTRLYVD